MPPRGEQAAMSSNRGMFRVCRSRGGQVGSAASGVAQVPARTGQCARRTTPSSNPDDRASARCAASAKGGKAPPAAVGPTVTAAQDAPSRSIWLHAGGGLYQLREAGHQPVPGLAGSRAGASRPGEVAVQRARWLAWARLPGQLPGSPPPCASGRRPNRPGPTGCAGAAGVLEGGPFSPSASTGFDVYPEAAAEKPIPSNPRSMGGSPRPGGGELSGLKGTAALHPPRSRAGCIHRRSAASGALHGRTIPFPYTRSVALVFAARSWKSAAPGSSAWGGT